MGQRSVATVRTVVPGMSAVALISGAVALCALVAAVAIILSARAEGHSYWGTSVTFVVGFPVAIVTLATLGWRIRRRGAPAVGRWVLATAASVLCYLVAVAIVTQVVVVEGRSDPWLSWIAMLALGGHIMPLVLTQATLLAVRDDVLGQRGRARPLLVALLVVVVVNFLLATGSVDPDPPLDPIDAPLADTWVGVLGTSPLWLVAWVAWVLTVLVGPLALWRAVNRSSQMARRRLAVAAVVSLLPVAIIASCVLVLPVLTVAGISEELAVDALFTLFVLGLPLTMFGVAVALSGRDAGLRLQSQRLAHSLDATLGLLFLLAALGASTLLAVTLAGRSLPAVVLCTVLVVAALWPVQRRLSRLLLLRADPRLAVAAALVSDARSSAASNPAAAAEGILRQALEDPGVTLAVRVLDGQGWVRPDGRVAGRPEDQQPDHVTTFADEAGRPNAYVTHGTTPADAAGTIAEVTALVERAVLEMAVRRQAEELAAERSRADRAAADERRRLERDLHDGVQGRLLALALDLQAAGSPPEAVASLRTAIEEMRRLATGSAPETLGRHGLAAAIADLADHLPVPVSLHVTEQRMDRNLETLAFLVVSEALTNAVKHAGPCTVEVVVAKEPHVLGIRVDDDGRGGADVRAGTGLRGMIERVQAAGGTVVVSEGRPRGTQVEVTLPCAQ